MGIQLVLGLLTIYRSDCIHNIDTLNICIKEFDVLKKWHPFEADFHRKLAWKY